MLVTCCQLIKLLTLSTAGVQNTTFFSWSTQGRKRLLRNGVSFKKERQRGPYSEQEKEKLSPFLFSNKGKAFFKAIWLHEAVFIPEKMACIIQSLLFLFQFKRMHHSQLRSYDMSDKKIKKSRRSIRAENLFFYSPTFFASQTTCIDLSSRGVLPRL